jgi:hypothetical protein
MLVVNMKLPDKDVKLASLGILDPFIFYGSLDNVNSYNGSYLMFIGARLSLVSHWSFPEAFEVVFEVTETALTVLRSFACA